MPAAGAARLEHRRQDRSQEPDGAQRWVLTGRPDIHKVIEEQGRKEGRVGGQNAWPADMLQPGDVCVCDPFGLKQDGPSIGDNVGNAIYARSHNGIVYDGAVRDINGLNELEDFVSFVRYYDPSHHFSSLGTGARLNSAMIGINIPIRIGKPAVMPGDVVLGLWARSTLPDPRPSRRISPAGCARISINCRWRDNRSRKS
jgi:hypothetical protein